jgi:hypothetical protein
MRLTTSSLLVALLLGLGVTFSSCKDKEDEVIDNCTEGRTGQLSIVTKMVHHTRPFPVVVYLSNTMQPNSQERTPSKYDYSVSANWDSPYATIDSLTCGNYYIYAVGIDSLLDPSDWVCKGGIAIFYRGLYRTGFDQCLHYRR